MQPGILSLLQDRGRLGQHRIGLTNGGPLDPAAFALCNRLLGNPDMRKFGALMVTDRAGRLAGVVTIEQLGRALRPG